MPGQQIARPGQEIEERMYPFEEEIILLGGIPVIETRSAQTILACIGRDESRFPAASLLASWAGLSPGNNDSAKSSRNIISRS